MALVNSNLIKARIYEVGMTQRKAALALGLEPRVFRRKIRDNTGESLTVSEVQELVKLLGIHDPQRYFFT